MRIEKNTTYLYSQQKRFLKTEVVLISFIQLSYYKSFSVCVKKTVHNFTNTVFLVQLTNCCEFRRFGFNQFASSLITIVIHSFALENFGCVYCSYNDPKDELIKWDI